MAAKQAATHHSDLPWYRQTHFLIAMVVIALLVGSHLGPLDSNASIAPPPSIETPAPVIEPAPIATPPAPAPVVQAPAPSPVTVVNVIGQDTKAAPQIIRELQPIIYRSTPVEPSPEPAEPSPSPEHKTTARSEHCEQMLAEHNRRVEEMRATLRSYHP